MLSTLIGLDMVKIKPCCDIIFIFTRMPTKVVKVKNHWTAQINSADINILFYYVIIEINKTQILWYQNCDMALKKKKIQNFYFYKMLKTLNFYLDKKC